FSLGAEVSITEIKDNETTAKFRQQLKSPKIKVELGRHTVEFIKASDLVVISPGVADSSAPIVWAEEFNIPVISEIEVASILCPAPIVAITGTNGKTTVTTLIGNVLSAGGKPAHVCGNIGTPFTEVVQKFRESDWVSLEVSSFQLEHIRDFKPKISLLLNLSRNHLDRYNNMDDYLKAKKRIFMNQEKDDFTVFNFDDPETLRLAKETKAKVVYFYPDKTLNPNESAVLAVSSLLGMDRELVLSVLRDFKGVEHRLERVAQIDGINFINDSKATTVDATIWALKNTQTPVILIAGGREKGNDYNLIKELAREKVKLAILIGEAKEKMGRSFSGIFPIEEAVSLEDAVNKAFVAGQAGDRILFSPMCKSFDMFTDYEERGRMFKQIVSLLSKGKAR
ncbi:MAG: Mur ligase family protein, partial [Candidatus Omnitrophota bacterium]